MNLADYMTSYVHYFYIFYFFLSRYNNIHNYIGLTWKSLYSIWSLPQNLNANTKLVGEAVQNNWSKLRKISYINKLTVPRVKNDMET